MVSWLRPTRDKGLATNEIHVWLVDLDRDIDALSRFAGYLSVEERTRAQHLRFDHDRRRFVLAKGTLRYLLGEYLGTDPHDIDFSIGPFGKPELSGRTQARHGLVHFNQAHSAHMAIYAFSRHLRVGVDIEAVRPFSDMNHVSDLLFTRHELERFQKLDDERRKTLFFETWTRKEAFVKALGDGLTLPLNEFDVTFVDGSPNQIVHARDRAAQRPDWSVKSIPVSDRFTAAICAEGAQWTPRSFKWEGPEA